MPIAAAIAADINNQSILWQQREDADELWNEILCSWPEGPNSQAPELAARCIDSLELEDLRPRQRVRIE